MLQKCQSFCTMTMTKTTMTMPSLLQYLVFFSENSQVKNVCSHNVFKRLLLRVVKINIITNIYNVFFSKLTLSYIFTHFNKMKKKTLGKHCGKR